MYTEKRFCLICFSHDDDDKCIIISHLPHLMP